jgi:DNA-binding XRE family transcriptional regulator
MIFHPDKLSAILIKSRIRKGYSQTYMAQQLRISQKAYSYIESGHCRLEFIRFLKIALITETHPMHIIENICEGSPSWKSHTMKEEVMEKEIEKLDAQIIFLKSENSFLRNTIDKILQKESVK